MARQLSTFPGLPASIQTVTLEGTQFRLRLTYRFRPAAWYLDLYALDGTALALGRRLSAGWPPLAGLSVPDGPDGLLYVRGLDDYARGDLGDALRLLYFTQDEVAAVAVATVDDVTVEIP